MIRLLTVMVAVAGLITLIGFHSNVWAQQDDETLAPEQLEISSEIEQQNEDTVITEDSPTEHAVTQKLLVEFEEDAPQETLDAVSGEHRVDIQIEGFSGAILTTGEEDIAGLVSTKNYIESLEGVKQAEYDLRTGNEDWLPNDPRARFDGNLDADHLEAVNAFDAWNYSRGSNVIVNHLDSGCNMNHVELKGKFINDWDFVNNDTDANDVRGHGTMTMSVHGATANNAWGTAGISPSVRIICSKIQENSGVGLRNMGMTNSGVLSALDWGDDNGAKVHACSFGDLAYSFTMKSYIYQLTRSDVFICSYGNNGEYTKARYPISYGGVTGVSASNEDGTEIAGYTNFGPSVNIAAPGTNIHSACATSNTCATTGSGTSLSSPIVSGVAALCYSRRPNLTGEQVRDKLQLNATDKGTVGFDNYWGYGLVNAEETVKNC